MTEFSLNTEFENFIKATLTDQKQQKQTEEMTTALEKNHNESAERPDFFQDNNVIKKNFFSRPSTIARIDRHIFYQIFHTLVSIKKIFIIETLYLTFTRF